MYYVEIYNINTKEVVKRIKCRSLRKAERVEDGAEINLDHKNYGTRIVEE